MKRTVCVVTSSRADYGSLKCLMEAIAQDRDLRLRTLVTGMHLIPAFGSTFRLIQKDGFKIHGKIPFRRSSETREGMAKAIGSACAPFVDAYRKWAPDWVVLFGDRFELYAAAIPASFMGIPIAHISGGEITEGAIDDIVRHALTKMAHVHFPAAEDYRRRIIQLGEQPRYVFNFGHLGLDNLHKLHLLDRQQLEQSLKFPLQGKVALVTFHPETLSALSTREQIENLLQALQAFDFQCVFTKANCDAQGRWINARIAAFCRQHPGRCKLFSNLGQLRYLSCLKHLDLMVGNSSSGLFEAPSFGIPVVNIGDRQKGRLRAENIVDVRCTPRSIARGIARALRLGSKGHLQGVRNPYRLNRSVRVGHRIKEVLKSLPINSALLRKRFFDLPVPHA